MTFTPRQIARPDPETSATMDRIMERIRRASRVQVLGHLRPDGDCIGSLLGMHHILSTLGIEHAMAAENQIYSGYAIIPGYELISTEPRAGLSPDLTIFLDCGDRARAFPDHNPGGDVINIDHHSSNVGYGDINWVDAGRASVGEMIYTLSAHAEIALTPDCANALLLAIMTDTGCFRYSSVRPEHLEICAELIRAGGDVTLVSKAAYESRSRTAVRVESHVLAGLRYEADGALAWGEATRELLDEVGGPAHLPEGMVSSIRSIDGVRVAIFFIQPDEPGIRMSFRGDGLVNVSALAGEFGGGGHPNAAGCTIREGNYTELRDRIVARTVERITEELSAARG